MPSFLRTSRIFLTNVGLFTLAFIFAPIVHAGSGGGGNAMENIFGTVSPPPGVAAYNDLVGGVAGPDGERIGLLIFMSRAIQIFTIVAGLMVFFNFLLAGYTYISSEGNSKANEEVKNRITYSVIGLIIIVCAYTITALLSLLIFGDATFVLNPRIEGPTP